MASEGFFQVTVKELNEQEDSVSTAMSTVLAIQEFALMLGKRVLFKLLEGENFQRVKTRNYSFSTKTQEKKQ